MKGVHPKVARNTKTTQRSASHPRFKSSAHTARLRVMHRERKARSDKRRADEFREDTEGNVEILQKQVDEKDERIADLERRLD